MFRARRRSRSTIDVLLWAGAIAGFLWVVFLLSQRTMDDHGSSAADAFAYWQAARRLADGHPIYGPGLGQPWAYLQPPPLAQLLSLVVPAVPFPAFAWTWRAIIVICLRLATGSWRTAGLSMLVFPPIYAEIEAGNLNLVVAAVVAATMRRTTWPVGPLGLVKPAIVASLPLAVRSDRRGVLLGLGAAAIVALASYAVQPSAWSAYLDLVGSLQDPVDQLYNVGRFVPTALRFAVAAILAVAALRAPILAPVAVTLASPVLWFNTLSTLVAVMAAVPDPGKWRVRRAGGKVPP